MIHRKGIFTLLLLILISLIVAAPILSKDKDKDKDPRPGAGQEDRGNNGRGGGQDNPAAPASPVEAQAPAAEPLLGCQKNNPDRLDCSSLEVTGYCDGTTAVFIIRNTGEAGNGDMRAPTQYRLIVDGVVVETGSVQLPGGGTMEIRYSGGGTVTLEADQQAGHPGGSHPRMTLSCGAPVATSTPELPTSTPTSEPPTPTEEATPTQDVTPESDLWLDAYCSDYGTQIFTITNFGPDMTAPVPYMVSDPAGNVIEVGEVMLLSGEILYLQYWDYPGTLYLLVDGRLLISATCGTATEEPTPEATPTEEVTPTQDVTPTEEVTPTYTPTPAGELGCQQNNAGRLDCSSLEVTGYCEGTTAVFVIRNTGEAGNGDMRAPTEYRLIMDGAVIETGSVQLLGNTFTEVRYDGGGTVTLEADQQTGHPGGSQPQATLNCGS